MNDNPDQRANTDSCPFALLRTISQQPINYKNFSQGNWLLRVDIFSNYKGEKKIKDYYNDEVLPKLKEIQQQDNITYISSTFSIMDEKGLGPVNKHGIITITVETMEAGI